MSFTTPQPANRPVDPVVADVAPAIYAAANKTNLTRDELNNIEQWSMIKKKHNELMAMSNDKAQAEFNTLDVTWQETLKSYFNVDYQNKPVNQAGWQKVLFGDDGLSAGDALKSPFRGLMWLGEKYAKAFNTVGNTAQLIAQGGASLNNKTLSRAWDGKSLYNESMANTLIEKHGGTRSYIAMKLLAGDTPAEIIDAWGPNDPEILVAMNEVFSNSEEFQQAMVDFKQAQLSPGRTIANGILRGLGMDPTEHKTLFSNVSGTLDFSYQILADPMTYLSFGGSAVLKGMSRATKITDELISGGNIASHFAKPEVAKFWNEYGGALDKLRNAESLQEKAQARNFIKSNFNAHNMDEDIDSLLSFGIKDAQTAQVAFDGTKIASDLIRGRVDSTLYMREGAAISRRTRNFSVGAKSFVRDVMKGKTNFNIADADVEKLTSEITRVGEDMTGTTLADMSKLELASEANRVQRFIGYMSAHHPLSKIVYHSDENVSKSLEAVREQAFLLTKNKATAEIMTAHFLSLTPAERITFRKGMDTATMQRMGLDKVSGGRELMQQIINDRYGVGGGLSAEAKVTIPSHARVNADGVLEGPEHVDAIGALHPMQHKAALGSLPWRDIAEHIAGKLPKEATKKDVVATTIGTAYNHRAVRMATDIWSAVTLLPRLGMRTILDEGFMFGLYLNTGLAKELVAAKRAGNVLTSASGSKRAVGPVKAAFQSFATKHGKKSFGAQNFIDDAERKLIFEQNVAKVGKANSGGVAYTIDEAYNDTLNEIFQMSLTRFGKKLSDEQQSFLWDAFRAHPRAMEDSTAAQLARATQGVTPRVTGERDILNQYQVDAAYEAFDAQVKKTFSKTDFMRMTESQKDLVQFRNMLTVFTGKPFILGKNQILDMPKLFLQHGGMTTKKSWDAAMDESLKALGFVKHESGNWGFAKGVEATPVQIRRFLENTRQIEVTDAMMQSPELMAQAAREFLTTSYADMYARFHGGADQVNTALLDFMNLDPSNLYKHRKVLRDLKFEDYQKLIKDNKVVDDVYTDLEFGPASSSFEDWYSRYADKAFEAMDRQINDVMRQPVTLAHYTMFRKQYKPFEEALYKTKKKELMQKMNGVPGWDDGRISEIARDYATRVYTEKALQDAGNHVMKYADNPEIRSVFSHNMRTAGRFYRAVEDFHRRLYRLVHERPLDLVYRMRLWTTGLAATGAVHKDADGKEYVVMPMDDVMFSAMDKGLRAISKGKLSVNQPLWNDFTLKISAGNPSFQDDAGMPYLSGPMGSISVMGLKGVLGLIPGGDVAKENVDDFLLGTMGDNPTAAKLIPGPVRNLWSVLNPSEKSQQETTAAMQAIAWNEANGRGLNEEDYIDPATGKIDEAAFEAARTQYLDEIKASAHNIIVMRTLFNLVSPISSSMQESKDLPDYLKDVGQVSLVDSFYETLDTVNKMYPDAGDPYELALATWSADNPGRLAYLPSRSEKEVGVVMKYTKSMQNWVQAHQEAISKYGESVIAFAPNTGKFNSGVYNWAKAAGFIDLKDIDTYMREVITQDNQNAYYDLKSQEDDALKSAVDSTRRRQIINDFKYKRDLILMSSPYLEEQINKIDNEKKSLFVENMYAASQDKSIKIPSNVRADVATVYQIYKDFEQYCTDVSGADNESDLKRAAKERAFEQINAIADADQTGIIANIHRSGIKGLMNARSRNARSSINLKAAQ